ncbi:hypothetical protein FA13DRAFT_1717464 [Coprinellus micaceus]|uniref:Uncharacterized protein n=1 Tax=Coprinellus micaceus TaxID=71717 RepID=A0A4Y7SFZ2_COPMI|nr:hypothetical protein FA13DRAFT_1717464 [Coprinellus micaceus]
MSECGGSVHDTRPTLAQLGGGLSSSAKSQFTIPTEQLQWPTLRTSAERGAKGQSTTFIPHLQWLMLSARMEGWHGIVVMRTVKGEVTIPAKRMSGVLPNVEGWFTVTTAGGWHGGARKCGGSAHASRKAHAVTTQGRFTTAEPGANADLLGRDPVAPGGANRTGLADGPQYISKSDSKKRMIFLSETGVKLPIGQGKGMYFRTPNKLRGQGGAELQAKCGLERLYLPQLHAPDDVQSVYLLVELFEFACCVSEGLGFPGSERPAGAETLSCLTSAGPSGGARLRLLSKFHFLGVGNPDDFRGVMIHCGSRRRRREGLSEIRHDDIIGHGHRCVCTSGVIWSGHRLWRRGMWKKLRSRSHAEKRRWLRMGRDLAVMERTGWAQGVLEWERQASGQAIPERNEQVRRVSVQAMCAWERRAWVQGILEQRAWDQATREWEQRGWDQATHKREQQAWGQGVLERERKPLCPAICSPAVRALMGADGTGPGSPRAGAEGIGPGSPTVRADGTVPGIEG